MITPKNTSTDFCQYLKSLRERSGMNITMLAKNLKVHRNTQVNYETDREPSVDYLLALSVELNIPFNQLIAQQIKLSDNPQPSKDKALSEVIELEGGDILAEMLQTGIKPRDDASKEYGQDLIKNLVEQLLDPGTMVAKNITVTINTLKAATATAIPTGERPYSNPTSGSTNGG